MNKYDQAISDGDYEAARQIEEEPLDPISALWVLRDALNRETHRPATYQRFDANRELAAAWQVLEALVDAHMLGTRKPTEGRREASTGKDARKDAEAILEGINDPE